MYLFFESNLGKYLNFSSQLSWNPLIVIEAQQRAIDKALSKPQPWQVHFREFRAYVDTVLDYLRRRGYNAKVCMRIASERDWSVDVRQEKMWIDDLNQKHHYRHYLYRKEGIFYGTYQVFHTLTISVLDSNILSKYLISVSFTLLQGGRWQFGLKDLGLATLRVSKMNIFPLQHDEKNKIKLLEDIEVKEAH